MGNLIKEFHELYPQVTFHLSNGNGDNISEKIDNGLLDVGFVLEPVELEKLNYITINAKERFGLLVKNTSPLAHNKVITPSDLINRPLINAPRLGTQKAFSSWATNNKLHYIATAELTTTAAILVKNDIGEAIVIEGSVKEATGNDLTFIPFDPELITHSLFIWKKYNSMSYTVSKFIDFVSKKLNNDI